MVEGIVGRGVQGDISIDDFDITDGACPQQGQLEPFLVLIMI